MNPSEQEMERRRQMAPGELQAHLQERAEDPDDDGDLHPDAYRARVAVPDIDDDPPLTDEQRAVFQRALDGVS